MGACNSSVHRVRPVFNALAALDPTGLSWLSTLLSLPSRSDRHNLRVDAASLGPLEDAAWSCDSKTDNVLIRELGWHLTERKLPAPMALLEILVDSLVPPRSESAWGRGETATKRRLLARGDATTRKEAHTLLGGPPRPSRWEILEGPSSPDVYLQTANTIVLIEGKFTERKPTNHTTWMSTRSQILRHLDAARDIACGRKLYGFFIVESADAPGWVNAVTETLSARMLEQSLPHRSADQRAAIADSFLGLTTWRMVCDATGLPLSLLRSEAELRATNS